MHALSSSHHQSARVRPIERKRSAVERRRFGIGISRTNENTLLCVHSLHSKTRERQRDRETHQQILRGRVPSGESSRDHAKHIYFISISISKSRVVVGMTFLALVCLRQKFTFFFACRLGCPGGRTRRVERLFRAKEDLKRATDESAFAHC